MISPINYEKAGLNLTAALNRLGEDKRDRKTNFFRHRVLSVIQRFIDKLKEIDDEEISRFGLFSDIVTMFRNRVLVEVDALEHATPELEFIKSNLRSIIHTEAKKCIRRRRAEKGFRK